MQEEGLIHYEVGEILGESCGLFSLDLTETTKLIIDFNKMNYINSVGVKEWINWVNHIDNELLKVELHHCKPSVVNQINMIRGFLPSKNFKIVSLYVPYYSDETNEEALVLIENGVHFKLSSLTEPMFLELPNPPLDRKGEPMEMDVLEEKYFIFLQNKK